MLKINMKVYDNPTIMLMTLGASPEPLKKSIETNRPTSYSDVDLLVIKA